MREDIGVDLGRLRDELEQVRGSLDAESRLREIEALDDEMSRPGFWDDPQRAQRIVRRRNVLEAPLRRYEEFRGRLEDVEVLYELAEEDGDSSAFEDVCSEIQALERAIGELRLSLVLSGEFDGGDAILSIHPGAGGLDAQEWAEMLMRMYTRWAERAGLKTEILDLLVGEEAGVKSVILSVRGDNAYGFLRAERGVHRLVRISPFDSSGRRHTSFAAVEVLPDLPEDDDVEINEEDLRVDTYRSSGAGGQHVNKTDSAVRITHEPTGIVVTCQNERSQHKNRAAAMKILRARLRQLQEENRREEMQELRGEQQEIAWGNQIRSYVFQPYTMVKDHRTGIEKGNIAAVMDGDLDEFMREYLEQTVQEERNVRATGSG
ncbi:MAG: peptide chain release factor 2 [Bacillota bacterium]